jgi:hypothetical protein
LEWLRQIANLPVKINLPALARLKKPGPAKRPARPTRAETATP